MDIIRVSRSHPCPICGKPDWCGYNSKIAICMRVPSQYPSKNGGWVHKLNSSPPQPKKISITDIPRSSDKELDKIYRKLLDILILDKHHYEHLRERGMSDDEIELGRYRTLPSGDRTKITAHFNPSEVKGIPGFGLKKGRLVLTGPPGLIIPVISPEGLIVSLLIRPDEQKRGSKYLLLSSRWLEDGSSPGARLHLAVPPKIRSETLWITEGPLKANIASKRLCARVLAVPGVSNWKNILKISLPEKIILAYDSDYDKNFQVKYHARKLANNLINNGHTVIAAFWEGVKGLDDALVERVPLKFKRLAIKPLPKQTKKEERIR